MKRQPDLIAVSEVNESPHLAPPDRASHPLWHAESPPLVAGTVVLVGMYIGGGKVMWPYCRVRAVIDGRARVEVYEECATPAGLMARGDVFDIDPSSHVHLALFDSAAGWRRECEQNESAAAAAQSTEEMTK
jgi:hypothetical protein